MRKLAAVFSIAVLLFGAAGHAAHAGHRVQNAVTLWWVIFNNPDACVANPGGAEQCGSVDVFGAPFLESVANGTPDPSLIAPNTDAGLAVIYATGGVTSYSGYVRLTASIYRSAPGGLNLAGSTIVDPMGLGRAFENPDAEIHLVVRDHGARVPGGVIEQTGSFLDPYCSDPNLLYFAGDNLCADRQFAVFGPGESGADDVWNFGNPNTKQRGAKAILFRNGDMVQAVVRTRVR